MQLPQGCGFAASYRMCQVTGGAAVKAANYEFDTKNHLIANIMLKMEAAGVDRRRISG